MLKTTFVGKNCFFLEFHNLILIFLALFTIITILGSMLIILAISLQFGKDLWHAPEGNLVKF